MIEYVRAIDEGEDGAGGVLFYILFVYKCWMMYYVR